jgi:hypothetical protein
MNNFAILVPSADRCKSMPTLYSHVGNTHHLPTAALMPTCHHHPRTCGPARGAVDLHQNRRDTFITLDPLYPRVYPLPTAPPPVSCPLVWALPPALPSQSTGRLTLDGLRAVLRLKLRRQPDSRPPRQHGQLVVSCRSCTSLAMSVSRGPSDRRGLAIAHRSMIEQICLESRPHTRSRRRPVSLLV